MLNYSQVCVIINIVYAVLLNVEYNDDYSAKNGESLQEHGTMREKPESRIKARKEDKKVRRRQQHVLS